MVAAAAEVLSRGIFLTSEATHRSFDRYEEVRGAPSPPCLCIQSLEIPCAALNRCTRRSLFALVTACSSPPAVTQEPSQNSADAGARTDAGAAPEDAGVVAVDSGPALSLEVGRAELSRKSVLLEDFDASAQLEAVVYNVDGVELPDAQVEWISGREGVVTVTDGRAAAVDRWGSAQVQARSGGVLSAPALVLVADPVEGALVVADDQVLGATPVDPEAELDIGWQYRVELAGLNEQPQAGGYLISGGEAGISGRGVG